MNNIRNFVITAHVDHGKSTLADRLLEATGTVEARRMRPQYLDQLELERERGITIKMAPVRMLYQHPARMNADETQINADGGLLYEDLTYAIRGAAFEVWNAVGPGFKESIYQHSLEAALKKRAINFIAQPTIQVSYESESVGIYRPDLLVDGKVIVELKALPFIGDTEKKQIWSYLRGSPHRLALLINFGPKKVDVERIVYDFARDQRSSASNPRSSAQIEQYVLNLIDTPGHSDFSYEVSRALAAVEGAVLLVDATKGIQAQTLSNFRAARASGLAIIGAVNKIDLQPTHVESVAGSLAELMGVPTREILRISGKTGEGVPELLEAIITRIPGPKAEESDVNRALIFDSLYDDHRGILAYIRVVDGEFKAGDKVSFVAGGTACHVKEVGYFTPELKTTRVLRAGDIGYLATGFKEPALVKIGDTIIANRSRIPFANIRESDSGSIRDIALPGYREPSPVVFISFYPDGATKFDDLKRGLERLRLTDAALSFEPDSNEALGRGMKVGFLGQLHAEIVASRLEREFSLQFLASFPSIAYHVKESGKDTFRVITDAHEFPADPAEVRQPMLKVEILAPAAYLGPVLNLAPTFDLEVFEVANVGENVIVTGRMPLAELIHDFDDRLKSASAGYASFSYELHGEMPADVEKLEILVAGEVASALTRIVPRRDVEREGRTTVERLKKLLPREQFMQALQARSRGRIIARETIPAMRKLLGNFGKTGGDRTRKMKLWKKQQRGKERLQERARVRLPVEVFREILKK